MSEKIKGMFGHPKRAEEVREWLKGQGAKMTNEEAKRWAELFNALAEGKTIERQMINAADDSFVWVQVDSITTIEELENYRIKPTPKTRRMTNQELADWLRDCPEEYRELKYTYSPQILYEYIYHEECANEYCKNILVRRNHGEWEEPLIVEE